MKSFWTASIVTAACLSFLGVAQNAATAATFTSTLTGDQEVGVDASGNFIPAPTGSSGIGTATLELSGAPGSYVLTYEVEFSDLDGVIAAPFGHIHQGAFGENGDIVHDLDGANVPPIAGSSSGTIVGDWSFDDDEPLTDALAADFVNSNFYFNLHTDLVPSGEIRGQIVPAAAAAVPEPNALLGLILFGTSLGIIKKSR